MAEPKQDGKELQRVSVSMYEITKREWGTLREAEEAFVKSATFAEYALLVNAIAASQIATRELYKPKFKTLEAYLKASKERLGISRAYFFERMRIGSAYMQYRGQLHAAGFREERDASNLRLFDKAQKVYGTEKAIVNLSKMSFREYQAWIWRKERGAEGERAKIQVTDDGILYDGEMVISARQVARIYEEGEEPFMIGVRSDSEKRALVRWLNDRREGKK